MTVFEQLQEILSDLSKSERKMAEYLLRYPHDIRRFKSESIAAAAGVSRSALIRLCKKLGYRGFSELHDAMLAQPMQSLPSADGGALPTALDCYNQCIEHLKTTVNPQTITEIATLLLRANRVVTLGFLHSELSARQMSFRLNRSHIDSHVISDSGIMENYTRILKAGDVALIFSISGNDDYLKNVRLYQQNRVTVVLFTMSAGTALGRQADYTVVLPFASHFTADYLMDDAITFFLAIEMVIEAIHKKLSDQE